MKPAWSLLLAAPALLTAALAGAEPPPEEKPPPAAPAPSWTPAPLDAPPAAVRAAAETIPAEPDAPMTVLLSDYRVDWLPDGHLRTRIRQVVRIEQRRGIDLLSTFSVPWEPSTTARPVLRARVIDTAGVAHPMDPTQFAESAAGTLGPDRFDSTRRIAGPLPRLAVGAIVETESTRTSTGPVFASGVRRTLPLMSPTRALHHRIEWRVPTGMSLTMAVVDSPVEPTVETVDGVDIWRAETRRAPGAEERLRRVAPDEDPPWDAIVSPRIVLGTTAGWGAAAREYHGVVEAALAGGVEPSLSAELPGDARAAARQVARRIQDRIRYTGVHFGRAAVIPRTPATVLDDGFGDCKDMAVLFVGAMRAAGHDAHVALVRAVGPGIEASVPGLGAFDHAIARVEADPPIWVDLTADSLVAGELGVSLYGRPALVVAPSTTGLTPLPRPAAEHNRFSEVQRWRIGPDGVTVSVDIEARGASARHLRTPASVWAQAGPRFVDSLMRARFATEAEPELGPAAPYPAEAVRVGGTVASPLGWSDEQASGVWYSADSVFELLPVAVRGDGPLRAVTLHAPFVDTLRITVEAPPGHAPADGPKLGEHRLGPATLTIEQDVDGEHPSWVWRFESGPRRWSADDVKAFRAAVAPFVGGDRRSQLRFEHQGHRALSEGRIGDGLRIYRELAEAGGVDAQRLYADRLADHGYPAFARRIAERLVEQHPERGDLWETLGYTRFMGLHGALTVGHDRPGAIAALEKALALDGALEWAPQGLVMAHGSRALGWRWGGDGMQKALAVARRYPALRATAAELALMLDRPAEALELLGDARGGDAAAVFLAATTLVDGPAAGMAGARRRMGDAQTIDTVVATALNRLLNMRSYPALLALATHARSVVPHDVSSGIFARLKRFTPAPPETPEAALGGLIHHLMARSGSPTAYATADLAADLPGTRLAADMDELAGKLRRTGGFERPAAADFLLTMPLESRSLPDGTWLASLRDGPRSYLGLVTRTADGLRVAALLGDAPAVFGRRIADALDRGDVVEAMRWRVWAVAGQTMPEDIIAAGHDPFVLAAVLTARAGDASLPLSAAALLAAGGEGDRARARSLMAALPDDPTALDGADLLLRVALTDDRQAIGPLLEAAVERDPKRHAVAVMWAEWLGHAGQADRAEALLAGLQPELGDRPDFRDVRMRVAAKAGRYADAVARGRALMADADSPGLRNSVAWCLLFVAGVDAAEPIGWLEGVPEERRGFAADHTLASLYALAGRSAEARVALERLTRGDHFPEVNWLVVGLLAEAEGLPDAARDAYTRLMPAADAPLDSSARLARLRLDALDGGKLAER